MDIEEALEKKKSQLTKAQERLDVKLRKNKRIRGKARKYETLIKKSREKIREYEALIEYHRGCVEDWEEKLEKVEDEVDFSAELEKRDKVKEEFEAMEVLAWDIKRTREYLDREEDEGPMKESLKQTLDKHEKRFKSLKGRGF